MDEEPGLPLWLLIFFFTMFFQMLYSTYLVFPGGRIWDRQ